MKIQVTLKDPDTMDDAVDDALKRMPRPEGVEPDEWDAMRETRAASIKSEITKRWMAYGEYLTVEFDMERKTATVIPDKP